eukprot:14844-Heterococcus_DN1.PRE.2
MLLSMRQTAQCISGEHNGEQDQSAWQHNGAQKELLAMCTCHKLIRHSTQKYAVEQGRNKLQLAAS